MYVAWLLQGWLLMGQNRDLYCVKEQNFSKTKKRNTVTFIIHFIDNSICGEYETETIKYYVDSTRTYRQP